MTPRAGDELAQDVHPSRSLGPPGHADQAPVNRQRSLGGSPEALPLLLTLSSGVKGYTTIHAGSARQALTRLRFICQLSDAARDLPVTALNALVSESVDLVVHCARVNGSPRVTEVLAVEELTTGADSPALTVTELFTRRRPTEPLTWTGSLPVRAGRALEHAGFDLHTVLAGSAMAARATTTTARPATGPER